jgi:aspartate/methionine/tyrosine aminotransferase
VARDVSPTLPELALIDDIEAIAASYEQRHGREPVNVSHWDPSREFARRLKAAAPIRIKPPDPVPYRFSYLVNARPSILAKLGFRPEATRILVSENGSSSITAVSNWLKLKGARRVVLLRPCYFTVPYNLLRLGLAVAEKALPRNAGGFSLPSELGVQSGDALWITNPVYNTGVYAHDGDMDALACLADAGVFIVADESLALGPTAFARRLGGHERFTGIYTPHKSICVNGLKFSAVAFHPEEEEAFEHWADVLSGGIGVSALSAVEHFLSEAFDEYARQFLAAVAITRAWHDAAVLRWSGRIELDLDARGHFVSVYFPHLEARLGNDRKFIAEAIEETGCTFIPGIRSGFDAPLAFSLRVNLAQDSPRFRGAVARLYRYLARL